MDMGKNMYGRGHALMAATIIVIILLATAGCSNVSDAPEKSYRQLQQEFVDLRWGMFICYNIMSYGARWGEANYPVDSFNPQKLDCNQWAAAAKSAGMKFGLLTTKHHEGFCLWDSEYTDYDVAGSPFGRDVVRAYVDAFRKQGMKIGLYYSIWDSTHEIEPGNIGEKQLAFVKGQIRELLSNYGKVDYFVVDGWFWKMGHDEVPFHEIRELIRELQPECLLTDHTHMHAPYHLDIPYYEGPFGAFPAEGNVMPSALGHCSVNGNGWFWGPVTPHGMKKGDGVDVVLEKLSKCEMRYCNFLLNCMPNRDGLMDTIFIDMLSEIGRRWKPDLNRALLPDPGKQLVYSVPIQQATASSGDASMLTDGKKIPGGDHTTWISDSTFPQNIVLDLGDIREVDVVTLVPDHRVKPAPEVALTDGNVTRVKLYAGLEREQLDLVAEGKWESDNLYRTLGFDKMGARYLRLEILDAVGGHSRIAGFEVGRSE